MPVPAGDLAVSFALRALDMPPDSSDGAVLGFFSEGNLRAVEVGLYERALAATGRRIDRQPRAAWLHLMLGAFRGNRSVARAGTPPGSAGAGAAVRALNELVLAQALGEVVRGLEEGAAHARSFNAPFADMPAPPTDDTINGLITGATPYHQRH